MNDRLVRVPGILRGLQRDLGLTVTGMALRVGITRPPLSNMLNGTATLSIPLALKIEREFGLNARELLIMQLDEEIAMERGYEP